MASLLALTRPHGVQGANGGEVLRFSAFQGLFKEKKNIIKQNELLMSVG
jgi:hypothetical protein